MKICSGCGKPFEHKTRKTCSPECQRLVSSKTMAKTNRKYASARMKERNPMHKPEIRELVRKRLKEIGHKPRIRGGNGKPSPKPVKLLLECLGDGFIKELVILTKAKDHGYPSCYKVDLGNRELMLAIEVDGNSHCLLSRQAQDQKKDRFLRSRGWTVLRFSNAEVMNGMRRCVEEIESTILKLKGHTHISQMVS